MGSDPQGLTPAARRSPRRGAHDTSGARLQAPPEALHLNLARIPAYVGRTHIRTLPAQPMPLFSPTPKVRRLGRGQRLVAATHNAGKVRELRELLAPHALSVASAAELGLPEP